MKHLVLGSTGTVGSRVVEALLGRGEEVRALTRSNERAEGLPEGASPVVGDLMETADYPRIFGGVDRLFLLNSVSPSELHEGLVAVNEARRHGIRRIVYLSVQAAERMPHVPHFAAKVQVEEAIRRSGIPWTILRPNNFYQNDLWFRDALLEHGVYPQPLGPIGSSRVDVGDIAEAAARVLGEGGFEGRTLTLVGPEALSGPRCAELWGEALGRRIHYGGDDLEAWGSEARKMLPDWMVWDFQLMYAGFQQDGLVATDADLEETRTVLGRSPRPFEDFARETASAWLG
jgi:uncharacterized protein YbjT (DUF2867 family)